MNDFYSDPERVRATTQAIIDSGVTVLQAMWLERSERDHCHVLLEHLRAGRRAKILDLGSGVGGVSRHMKHIDPDLNFVLVNQDQGQIELSSSYDFCFKGNMEDMPYLKAREFDAVMINYSLGHASLRKTLAEVKRVLRPGGRLLIYDVDGNVGELPGMNYRVYGEKVIMQNLLRLDFIVDTPLRVDEWYSDHMTNIVPTGDFERVFGAVIPLLITATRGPF